MTESLCCRGGSSTASCVCVCVYSVGVCGNAPSSIHALKAHLIESLVDLLIAELELVANHALCVMTCDGQGT